MTPELETYFNNYFELFSNAGWNQLIAELEANAVNINNASAVSTLEDLHYRKGQLSMLGSIVNLKETIEANYDDAVKSPEDEVADYAEGI